MKNLGTVLILGFIFISCQKGELYDVKVGMTYEDVEKLLGKPVTITRGITYIAHEISELNKQEIAAVYMSEDSIVIDPRIWPIRGVVKDAGQFLYVTWIFVQQKADTHFVLYKKDETKQDTVWEPGYFVNGKRVAKEEFDMVGEYVHYSSSSRSEIVPEHYWLWLIGTFGEPGPPREKAIKKIITVPKILHRKIIGRKYYEVRKLSAVVFDASSGRVVQVGFLPSSISEISK